jgi:hypothetical protein
MILKVKNYYRYLFKNKHIILIATGEPFVEIDSSLTKELMEDELL